MVSPALLPSAAPPPAPLSSPSGFPCTAHVESPRCGRAPDPGAFFAPEELELPSCRVRTYLAGDGARLAEATNASYAHLQPFMPWARPDQPLTAAEATVRRFRGRWLLEEDYTLAILSPDGQTLLGGAGFHLRFGPRQTGIAELGMWVRQDATRRGIGLTVLDGLLRWGFEVWGWQRLVWRCAARNEAGRRLAERAGLGLEGVTRCDRTLPGGVIDDTLWFGALAEAEPARRRAMG